MSDLTPKQARFVEEYLIDLNATQAAIKAGYSAKTAQAQSSRLLSNVIVQEAVEAARKARSERAQVNQDDVIKGLLNEARHMGEGTSHGARVSAWAHLGRHLGMFNDKLALSGNVTVEVVRFSDRG